MKSRLALILLLLLVAAPARAAVAVKQPLDDLVRNADVVVRGTVTRSESFQDEENKRIYTRHTVAVLEYLKGKGDKRLLVVTMGGELEDIGQLIPGEARLEPGEEVVLCLVQDRRGWVVASMAQGKFRVEPRDDAKVLTRSFRGLHFVGTKAPSPTRGDEIPLDTFRELVRRLVQ